MNLAIVGYRKYNKKEDAFAHIDAFIKTHGMPNKIISGGADGADSLAKLYAYEHKIPFEEFPPDWGTYGKRAGPMRNTKIVEHATHVLAFVSKYSKGTNDTIIKATNRGLPITAIGID